MLTYKSLLIATAVAALLSACGGGGGGGSTSVVTPPPAPNPVLTFSTGAITKSANADTLGYEPTNKTNALGDYLFTTNVWGVKSAYAYNVVQKGSVDTGAAPQTANVSVEWDVTPAATTGVVAYPSFIYGKHPGLTKSSNDKLPVQVSSISTLKTSGTASTICLTICGYNTSFDIFLMNTPTATASDIGTEILFHSVYTYGHQIAPDGYATFNNIIYKVYHNSFGSKWNTIVYEPPYGTEITNLSIDLKEVLTDAQNRSYIKSTDYLVSIEFGTEVTFGKGTTTVSNFKVQH